MKTWNRLISLRVGFKDVWLMAISGDYCVFKNDSVIVEKE